jgi:CubicO group peptidase (beta-lactamase class C family)
MRLSGVPGLSAAFVERDQVVWSEGFGVCRDQSGDRISAETVFAVASLSKPPFAHIVLRLCNRGVLDLDTPLADLYPEPYDARGLDPHAPELRRVTARHVLSHTSGLGNFEESDIGRIAFSPGSHGTTPARIPLPADGRQALTGLPRAGSGGQCLLRWR